VERFRPAEILFNPKQYAQPTPQQDTADLLGVQELIQNSLATMDIDARATLLNNIVITGGSTLFPTFTERINNEIYRIMPGVRPLD
jgi:actin-related protein 4